VFEKRLGSRAASFVASFQDAQGVQRPRNDEDPKLGSLKRFEDTKNKNSMIAELASENG